MMKKLIVLLLALLGFNAQAGEPQPDMADSFREDGKIYVVIAVMAIVFVCLAVYLFMLDRKVKKLEDKSK